MEHPSSSSTSRRNTATTETLPTSVLCVKLSTHVLSLLVGMGDGQLFIYSLDEHTGETLWCFFLRFTLTFPTGVSYSKRKISLGGKPIELALFSSANTGEVESKTHVIVCCDRPAVIYSGGLRSENVLISNINVPFEALRACTFDTAQNPGCVVMAHASGFVVGVISNVQRMHIRRWVKVFVGLWFNVCNVQCAVIGAAQEDCASSGQQFAGGVHSRNGRRARRGARAGRGGCV